MEQYKRQVVQKFSKETQDLIKRGNNFYKFEHIMEKN